MGAYSGESQGTSKAEGSWNQATVESEGTSKAGGSWNNQNSTRSRYPESESFEESRTNSTKSRTTSASQGTSKAEGSSKPPSSQSGYLPDSDKTSSGQLDITGQYHNNVYGRLYNDSSGQNNGTGSYNDSPNFQKKNKNNKFDNAVGVTAHDRGAKSLTKFTIGKQTIEDQLPEDCVDQPSKNVSLAESDQFVPLNYQSMLSKNGSIRGNMVYGNDSIDYNISVRKTLSSKGTSKAANKTEMNTLSQSIRNLTIDNSVNAVRAWSEIQAGLFIFCKSSGAV